MVGDVVSEKNSYTFEAEEFRQDFLALHYVIGVAAYYTCSLDSHHYFFLNLFFSHTSYDLLQLGLDNGWNNLQENLVEVGEAGSKLWVSFLLWHQLDIEAELSVAGIDGVCHVLIWTNWLGCVFVLLELRIDHGDVEHSNHVNVLAIKNWLLTEQLEVVKLFALDQVRGYNKDAAGGARNYV